MRKQLTIEEWNAVSHLTSTLKLDSSFDIGFSKDKDFFCDYDNHRKVSLKTGFKWISEALSYPLEHDLDDAREIEIITNLMREFVDPDWKE